MPRREWVIISSVVIDIGESRLITMGQTVQFFSGSIQGKFQRTAEMVQSAPNGLLGHGLGLFICSLVGMNRDTAKQAVSQFVTGTTATASQLEFIDLIVEALTETG